VAASASADLLVLARDGDQARLGPKSLGKATRFVVDHAACPVLLIWPGSPPGVATIPRRHITLPRQGAEAANPGHGLWLAATLADELSITSGPDRTIASLDTRLD